MMQPSVMQTSASTSNVPAADELARAAAYADGLFETIAFFHGRAPWWRWHMQRLQRDARRLALASPAEDVLLAQATCLAGNDDCVLRLTLARAQGQGYWPLLDENHDGQRLSRCELRWQRRAMPAARNAGLRLDWAELQLGSQPLLAGIKHLARLEQVLAACEAQRRGVDELLLCDQQDCLVEAISSNVLVWLQGQWLTPVIDRCGVNGVLRSWLLDKGLITAARLQRAELAQPAALALCNSVRGIMPVTELAQRPLPDSAATSVLMDAVTACRRAAR